MTAPSQLVPGRKPPSPIELQEVDEAAAGALAPIYVRVGEPHGWEGRTDWSSARWESELARPGVQAWIARVNGDIAGLVELEAGSDGDVGVVVFGLVPEYAGKGFGGHLLTLATRLAWR